MCLFLQASLYELLGLVCGLAEQRPVGLTGDHFEADILLRPARKRGNACQQHESQNARRPYVHFIVVFFLIAELWGHVKWTAE